MHSTTTQSKNYDKYSPSAIRGDMMKLQQQIHRIHNQFDQVSQLIPPDLPNNLPNLINQMQILNTRVNAETQYNYSKEIASLEKKINELSQKLTMHENVTKNLKNMPGDYNDNSLSDLEKKITASNNLFLDNLHTKIKQRLEKYAVQQDNNTNSNEPKTIDLHLSANFPSNSETENSRGKNNTQIIKIETNSTLDPAIHQRVKRHSDRIQLVEEDFDRLLLKKVPNILPQKQIQQIFSKSEQDKKQIIELENKYNELESTLRDIKQERQELIEKKKKMKEATKNIPGAVTFSEFSDFKNKLFDEFNNLSIEITTAQNEVNDSFIDLNENLNSIDKKINDFKQCANDFNSLIKLTDKKIYDVEVKMQKQNQKIEFPENFEEKLNSVTKNNEMKINQLSQHIKSRINEVKKSLDEIKNESKIKSKNNHSKKPQSSNKSNNIKLPPTNPPDEN